MLPAPPPRGTTLLPPPLPLRDPFYTPAHVSLGHAHGGAREREARAQLAAMGHETTISYLVDACRAVLEETSLLPHANPGALIEQEALALREVSISQGTMLETLSERLLKRGMAHFGAPDKRPEVRLETLEAAGRA